MDVNFNIITKQLDDVAFDYFGKYHTYPLV